MELAVDILLWSHIGVQRIGRNQVGAAVLAATWLINILAFFLECRPVQLYWQVLPLIDQCAVSTLKTSLTSGSADLM